MIEARLYRVSRATSQIGGRDRVTEFFATAPAGGRLDLIRLVLTSANGLGRRSARSRPVRRAVGGALSFLTRLLRKQEALRGASPHAQRLAR